MIQVDLLQGYQFHKFTFRGIRQMKKFVDQNSAEGVAYGNFNGGNIIFRIGVIGNIQDSEYGAAPGRQDRGQGTINDCRIPGSKG